MLGVSPQLFPVGHARLVVVAEVHQVGPSTPLVVPGLGHGVVRSWRGVGWRSITHGSFRAPLTGVFWVSSVLVS